MGQLAGGCHAHPDTLEDRTRPIFSGVPAACDVFTYREHAVGRTGCTGARLVRKVKRAFALSVDSGQNDALLFDLQRAGEGVFPKKTAVRGLGVRFPDLRGFFSVDDSPQIRPPVPPTSFATGA